MKKKNPVSLFIVIIWIAIIILGNSTGGMFVLLPMLLLFAAPFLIAFYAIKKKNQTQSEDSFSESSYSAPPPSSSTEDFQNYGQSAPQHSMTGFGEYHSPRGTHQSLPLKHSDDHQHRRDELRDLLNAGIIEMDEYRERMQDLR